MLRIPVQRIPLIRIPVEFKVLQGDCLEILKTLPSESVHCCVTSPPYYALRNYQMDGQIGLEKTPEKYVEKLVQVFREVNYPVLKYGAWNE